MMASGFRGMKMIWLLLSLAGQGLTLKTGKIVYCDDFWIEDPMVIIQEAGNRYTLRSELFDWAVPIKASARQSQNPAKKRQVSKPSGKQPGPGFMAFVIDKLEVEQASVIDVLRLLAHRAHFNLIIDHSVSDTPVTFSFRQMPLRDVLHVLLGTLGLSYEYQAQHLWIRAIELP